LVRSDALPQFLPTGLMGMPLLVACFMRIKISLSLSCAVLLYRYTVNIHNTPFFYIVWRSPPMGLPCLFGPSITALHHTYYFRSPCHSPFISAAITSQMYDRHVMCRIEASLHE